MAYGDTDASAGYEDGTELCSGHGASPGTGTGPVRIIDDLSKTDRVDNGDIIVTEMTMPEMVPAMKRAAGIVTDEGGTTCHAAIVSRELGIPSIVGTGDATDVLDEKQTVAVDGERGTIVRAEIDDREDDADPDEPDTTAPDDGATETVVPTQTAGSATTATGVKVNVSIPSAAERAAETGADGVGLLRLEHILLSMGKTPQRYVSDHGAEAFVESLADELEDVADAFYPRPVRARTLDAPTDELAELEGGEDEPHEHNPMLGWRGIRRSLDEPELVKLELRAFKTLHDRGYDNVGVMFPLPNDPWEVAAARDLMAEVGIDPDKRRWGTMIETPASVHQIHEIIETGIDFVALGTNDLIQYYLAVDRNNGQVADRFDAMHPSVLDAMGRVIEACNEHGIDTTITGQAGSKPEMARFLVRKGISSVSANIDAVNEVRAVIDTAERQMLLDAARSQLSTTRDSER
jgi:pyruvate,water dikinase